MRPLGHQGSRLLELSIVLILLGLLTFIFMPAPPSVPQPILHYSNVVEDKTPLHVSDIHNEAVVHLKSMPEPSARY